MQQTGRPAMNARQAARVMLALSLVFTLRGQAPPGPAGSVRGAVFTVESCQQRSLVPGARLWIRSAPAGKAAVAVTTDEIGRHRHAGRANRRRRSGRQSYGSRNRAEAGQNSLIVRTDGTLAPCFPMYSASCDWGVVGKPGFDGASPR